MILDQLRKGMNSARKGRDSEQAQLLGFVIATATAVGKRDNRDPTDAEVIAVLRKQISSNEETIKLCSSDGRRNKEITVLTAQNVLFSSYLPSYMSEVDLTAYVNHVIVTNNLTNQPSSVSVIFSNLKETHAGLFDPTTATTIIKEVLNGKFGKWNNH
jgi:uncharacterized protein YqeY